ncbi:MAG: hypothetical protein ABSF50_15620 [Burkholderiaceae bacterium]|jgi:hypothetical protein
MAFAIQRHAHMSTRSSKRGGPVGVGLFLTHWIIACAAVWTLGAMAMPKPAATNAATSAKVIEITVRGGRRVQGPAIVKVHQDDDVTLVITDDAADELHLHGYDLHASIQPGVAATIQFRANRTGRFTFELHKANVELGAIEVYPK